MIGYILTVIGVIGIMICLLINYRRRIVQIAFIEFGEKVSEEIVRDITMCLPIHWYTFNEDLNDLEKQLEIEDLKEHYELVLEVK